MIVRITIALTLLTAAALQAQESAHGYQMPPPVLANMVDAPPTPWTSLSPDRQWLLLMERPGNPSIEEVSQPELRLAGLRINPRNNSRARARPLSGLVFQNLSSDQKTRVDNLPTDARIHHVSWSPDGSRIAFAIMLDNQLSLWSAETGTTTAKQISPAKAGLNNVYGRPYAWLNNDSFVVRLIPEKRGSAPTEPTTPAGPVVQQNLGKKAPARTLQDLLQNSHDEALFDHYTTSQLAQLTLRGKLRKLGTPGVIRRASTSPDGQYVLVEQLNRPYSYSLQANRFPHSVEVWDLRGRKVHTVADEPLKDQVPVAFGSVPTGPRSINWRADHAAELVWTEALDGGDGGAEADERDQVYTLAAPFDGQPEPLIKLAQRYGGVQWANDRLAMVVSWWWKNRNVKVWQIAPGNRQQAPKLIEDRSWQDRYADPGEPMQVPNRWGRSVMLTDNDTVFLSGSGASPEGDRPFVDAWNIADGSKQRLFRSSAPYYESPIAMLDVEDRTLLTRRESQTEPANYFIRDLNADQLTQKTFFPNPTPQLKGISKELITYTRADGVELSGTLYLPAGYDKQRDGPLPVLLWAYPNEFKSKQDAGQVQDSPYRFTRVGWWSPMLFLTRGFAVLDDPSMPVIGEGEEEPNDTFVEQLVSSAEAAIDELVERGVGDRDRMAIGGHSYGAFMTANLLAHSDLFRAGVARSGAYNRTLTPFGFQAEERTVWQAPEIYFAMSPFMHAEKIDEPILLIHGDADNNSGTYPMQSERLYGALKGLGGFARLVMLPHESHGYRARESIQHMIWETDQWLQRYVKSVEPRPTSTGDLLAH